MKRADRKKKGLQFQLDLAPSLEIRLEAAKELFPRMVASLRTTDTRQLLDWARQISWIRFCDDHGATVLLSGDHHHFLLHCFLAEHGIEGWALIDASA